MRLKKTPVSSNIGEDYAPGPIICSLKELDQKGVLEETVLRVSSARVVYVNYALLQHDFPFLQNEVIESVCPGIHAKKGVEKTQAIRAYIDQWLLRHTAYVSQSQASQSIVNTPIPLGHEQVKAFRPPGYGRALVFSVEETEKSLLKGNKQALPIHENRLIDVKGTGVGPHTKPVDVSHKNGLYKLGYAFIELLVQELLQRIFRHSETEFQTLPNYAIIDLGFDEISQTLGNVPAGLLVRRAHRRPRDSGGLYPYNTDGQLVQLEIEQLLRTYGITSVNDITTLSVRKENGQLQIHYGEQHIDFFNEAQQAVIERVSHIKDGMGELIFEGINIQHTREISVKPYQATLVDFQTYSAVERFENPMLSLVSDKLLRWGGTIWPDYDDYVQPHPALKISSDIMSGPSSIHGYHTGEGKKDRLKALCYGLAADVRANRLSRERLLEILQSFLDELTAHWAQAQ